MRRRERALTWVTFIMLAALSVVADQPLPATTRQARLAAIAPLRHATVEVHRCPLTAAV